MRKALLVITLVAASFAGGAAVNGPGLQWVKGQIARRLHASDSIPTLDVDDGPPKAEAEAQSDSPPPDAIPSAPAPPLTAALTKPATPSPADEPKPPAFAEAAAPPVEEPKPLVEPPVEEPKPAPEPSKPAAEAEPPPLTPPSEPAAKPEVEPIKPQPKAGGWSDAPGPAPATAVLPKTRADRARTADAAVSAARAPAEPTPAKPAAPGDWDALRKRMRAMGVTRYWVEGTPGGPATFRCVVPASGDATVGQQFEAEGDDELRAAESALRRVAVWQATEKLKE